jgi:hypothetical protein
LESWGRNIYNDGPGLDGARQTGIFNADQLGIIRGNQIELIRSEIARLRTGKRKDDRPHTAMLRDMLAEYEAG